MSESTFERWRREYGNLYTAAIRWVDMPPATGELPPHKKIMSVDGPHERAGPEHGFKDERTLCGLRKEEVSLMRHYWNPEGADACRACFDMVSGKP